MYSDNLQVVKMLSGAARKGKKGAAGDIMRRLLDWCDKWALRVRFLHCYREDNTVADSLSKKHKREENSDELALHVHCHEIEPLGASHTIHKVHLLRQAPVRLPSVGMHLCYHDI